MIPFGERNECSKVVFSLMVLRIIMHFWCASSLLCLLSPCLSKVVQWFNVFRYRIPSFMTIINFFACCPLARQVYPKPFYQLSWTSCSWMIFWLFVSDRFSDRFSGDRFLWDRFSGNRFSGTDWFSGTNFRTDFWHIFQSCFNFRQHCTLSQTQIKWYLTTIGGRRYFW